MKPRYDFTKGKMISYDGEIIEFAPTEELLLDPKEKLTKEYVRGFLS